VERTTLRSDLVEYVFAVWQAEHRDNICRVIEATRTFGERKSAKRLRKTSRDKINTSRWVDDVHRKRRDENCYTFCTKECI